jgi:hypothetical protein
MKSEHEHHGPYMYLEVKTGPEPDMDDHGIHGDSDNPDMRLSEWVATLEA